MAQVNGTGDSELDRAPAGVTLQRQKLDLTPGALVSLDTVVHRITEVLDFDTVVGVEVESGRSRSLRIAELSEALTGLTLGQEVPSLIFSRGPVRLVLALSR